MSAELNKHLLRDQEHTKSNNFLQVINKTKMKILKQIIDIRNPNAIRLTYRNHKLELTVKYPQSHLLPKNKSYQEYISIMHVV